MRGSRRAGAVLGAAALALALTPAARADTVATNALQATPGPDAPEAQPLGVAIAVLGLDALGVDRERVSRLEALFRIELQRLSGRPVPSPGDLQRVLKKNRRLRRCGGQTRCTAAIGKKLGVDLVVTGNVASLGDSYVVNIKVVDVAKASEVRRISSEPMRGDDDNLIEPIRVAAYRLLAPDKLLGSISVLADIKGAAVELDGTSKGMTPLPGPIRAIPIGKHRLKVTASGYSTFEEEVDVRFQKTSRVVVRLVTPEPAPGQAGQVPLVPAAPVQRDRPFYNKTWFYVAAGVTAVVVGGIIGWSLASSDVTDCSQMPEMCRP